LVRRTLISYYEELGEERRGEEKKRPVFEN
jgi:hypothetical protein